MVGAEGGKEGGEEAGGSTLGVEVGVGCAVGLAMAAPAVYRDRVGWLASCNNLCCNLVD